MNQIATIAAIALNALALRQQASASGLVSGLGALLRWALAMLAAATFAGCGGHGSSAEPAPPEPGSDQPALGATPTARFVRASPLFRMSRQRPCRLGQAL